MINEPQMLGAGSPSDEAAAKPSTRSRIERLIIIGVVVLFAVLIVLIAVAIFFSRLWGEPFSETIRIVRDLVIIFLALEGALIILALAILILQVARLVNLVQTEVKPMLENTQSALTTVRGTVEFMSDNLTEPVVRASGFLTGFSVLTRNLLGIRQALKQAEKDNKEVLG